MDLYTLRNSVCLLTALYLCFFIGRLDAQSANLNNLDILEPIVRRSPADGTDFFGFATVLHQVQTVNNGDDLATTAERTRIIVGAPMGTFPGGLPLSDPGQPAENQTGLVYSCPVQPGVCEGVQGDTSITARDIDADMDPNTERRLPNNGPVIEGRLFDQAPNAEIINPSQGGRLPFEIKTGQLMGATLYSTGDNFVACAPRWTVTQFTTDEQPLGACYTSGRQLNNFQFLQPCTGSTSANPVGGSYCMAGVSVARVGNVYAVAAPGYNFLQGVVYYGADNAAIRTSPPQPTQGQGQANQPDSSGNLVEILNMYQGFQTTTGFITRARSSGQTPDHIATVPRYNGTTYTGRVNIVNGVNGNSLTGPYLSPTAEGQQMGEFFGYSIAAVDLNGDGYDELVVGAPMYTAFDGGTIGIERGRVYVFTNTGGDLSQPGMVLQGQVDRGRFGNSVTNLGDIDDDGYEDIAVGAPYEAGNGAGNGAVYIYYGRADMAQFMAQTPFQIRADQIVDNVEGLNELRTFGWSLSSGVDVDNNEYNDLSIGAYESKTVVLLRTLPVANVNVSFDPVPPVVIDPMSCSCFNLTVRATYTGRGLSGTIDISYNITENIAGSSSRRLTVGDERSVATTRTLRFSNQQTAIDTVTVYADNRITEFNDPFVLRVDLLNINRTITSTDGNQSLTDLSAFPRVRNRGDSTTQVSLSSPCDPVCLSDVEIQVDDIRYIDTTGVMTTDATSVVAGRIAAVNITLQYRNIGMQTAFGTTLSFNQQLAVFSQYRLRVDGGTRIRDCSQNGDKITCVLPRRLASSNQVISDVLELVVAENLGGNAPDAVFTFNLDVTSPSSNETNLANNIRTQRLSVTGQADLSVTMANITIRQSENLLEPIDSLDDLGMFRDWTVTVNNRGPTDVQEARVIIYFPSQSEVTGDDYFLYPGSITSRGSPQSQTEANCSMVNPDGFTTPTPSSRRRRQIEMGSSLERVVRQVESPGLTCPDPDPNGGNQGSCFPIICNISRLEATVPFRIVIRAYVDNRFYARQTPRREYVLVPTARVSIIDSFLPPETNLGDNVARSTITIQEPLITTTGVPPTNNPLLIHAIIWPVVGGVILIILLAVALYCFGFFRRKSKKTLEQEAEAEGDFDPNKFKVQQVGEKGVETVTPPVQPETTQL